MEIVKKHLPSYCYSRTKTRVIQCATIHYFSNIYADPENWSDVDRCWELFCDLNKHEDDREYGPWKSDLGETKLYNSADFLISQTGIIYELVPINYGVMSASGPKSWHAGKSILHGKDDVNTFSCGIELIAAPFKGPGFGFTSGQYESLAWLIRYLGINVLSSIAGHDQIRMDWKKEHPEVSDREVPYKHDPGPHFDWNRFREIFLSLEKPSYDLDGG